MIASPSRTVSLAVALLTFLSACRDGTDSFADGSTYMTRDSAGISIVENTGNAIPADAAWRLAPEPSRTIGVTDGDEAYQLFRVGSALRFEDGGVVIVNNGTDELRFFDAAGAHIRTVGGSGDGPGELRSPLRVEWFTGDTIGVMDIALARVDLFTREGDFLRTVRLPSLPNMRPVVHGLVGEGWLLRAGPRPEDAEGGPDDPGISRVAYAVVSEGGEPRETFEVAGFEGGSGTAPVPGLPAPPPAFFRRGAIVAGNGMLVYADTRTREIQVRDLDGRVTRIIRHSIPFRPVTPEVIDRYVSTELAGIADPARRVSREEQIREAGVADTLPTLSEMFIDHHEGLIWVGDFALPWDEDVQWTAFSPEGVQMAQVTAPARLRVLEIGSDYLLALDRNEFDVEQVVVYPIIKPE